MDRLTFELNGLCDKNRDGSYQTQRDRKLMLKLIARQLREMGFKKMQVSSLKTKHITRLVMAWKHEVSPRTKQHISTGTIKNRMAVLRWWTSKINKQNIIPRENKALDIDDRRRVPMHNKAYTLHANQLIALPRYLQHSLRLQQEFGLRREEAAKFIPKQAIKAQHIHITASWAKGGRERNIPITTTAQRELLTELNHYQYNESLIPPHYSYKAYLMHRQACLDAVQLKKTHGLRHYYAQSRYRALTNDMKPPFLGGKKVRKMTDFEKLLDKQARQRISLELGHARIEITRIYLG